MEAKTDDELFNAKITMLAATMEGQALEHALDQALFAYLQFFGRNGIGPLVAVVKIEQRQEPKPVDPTCELRRIQMLGYLTNIHRTGKGKARKNAADMIRDILGMMPTGRGH